MGSYIPPSQLPPAIAEIRNVGRYDLSKLYFIASPAQEEFQAQNLPTISISIEHRLNDEQARSYGEVKCKEHYGGSLSSFTIQEYTSTRTAVIDDAWEVTGEQTLYNHTFYCNRGSSGDQYYTCEANQLNPTSFPSVLISNESKNRPVASDIARLLTKELPEGCQYTDEPIPVLPLPGVPVPAPVTVPVPIFGIP
jgi:hypothetical protein